MRPGTACFYAGLTVAKRVFLALGCLLLLHGPLPPLSLAQQSAHPAAQGDFLGSTDIGSAQPGFTEYDPLRGTYRLGGGGADVWGTADSFRFTWTRLAGDLSLAADLHVDAPVTFRLAKGMLMFRQSLDPGSPYADIAIHADGHITLQYRLTEGGETKDVTLPEHNAVRLRLVRRGDRIFAYAGEGKGSAKPPSITLAMPNLVYVGLGVCSHNTDALQSVTFRNVTLQSAAR